MKSYKTNYADKIVSIDFNATDKSLKSTLHEAEVKSDKLIKTLKSRNVFLDKYNYDVMDSYVDSLKNQQSLLVVEKYQKEDGYFAREENLKTLKNQQKDELKKEIEVIKNDISELGTYVTEKSPELNHPYAMKPSNVTLVMIIACIVDGFLNFTAIDAILSDLMVMTLIGTCFVCLLCDIICPSIIGNKLILPEKTKADWTILGFTVLCNYIPLIILAFVRIQGLTPENITINNTTIETQISSSERLVAALFGVIPILTTIAVTISMILYSVEAYQSFYALRRIKRLNKILNKKERMLHRFIETENSDISRVQTSYLIEQAKVDHACSTIKMILRLKFKQEFAEDPNDVNFLTEKERELIYEESMKSISNDCLLNDSSILHAAS